MRSRSWSIARREGAACVGDSLWIRCTTNGYGIGVRIVEFSRRRLPRLVLGARRARYVEATAEVVRISFWTNENGVGRGLGFPWGCVCRRYTRGDVGLLGGGSRGRGSRLLRSGARCRRRVQGALCPLSGTGCSRISSLESDDSLSDISWLSRISSPGRFWEVRTWCVHGWSRCQAMAATRNSRVWTMKVEGKGGRKGAPSAARRAGRMLA